MGHKKNPEDVKELLDSIFFCFFAIKRYGKRILEQKVFDLTLEQVIVLKILADCEGINLSELAEAADRDKTTTSRMVTGLEKRNLVVRVPDKSDSRQKLIYLTHDAKAKLEELDDLKYLMEEAAYKDITPEEQQAAMQTLLKVARNVIEK